jgi:hypothetical protein
LPLRPLMINSLEANFISFETIKAVSVPVVFRYKGSLTSPCKPSGQNSPGRCSGEDLLFWLGWTWAEHSSSRFQSLLGPSVIFTRNNINLTRKELKSTPGRPRKYPVTSCDLLPHQAKAVSQVKRIVYYLAVSYLWIRRDVSSLTLLL